jgi:hypothetical protein
VPICLYKDIRVLKKISRFTIVYIIFVLITACGSGNYNSDSHMTESGTTPLSASKFDSFHGTYKLSKIYSNDLSIVKAEGTQLVDYKQNKIKISLVISTFLDTYKIEREYPIEFSPSALSFASAQGEEYESENSSIKEKYFIDTQFLAAMPEFQALLSMEWQKVSDKIKS